MIPDNWFDLPLPGLNEEVAVIDSPVTKMDVSPQLLHRRKLTSEIGIGHESQGDSNSGSIHLRPKPAVKKKKNTARSVNKKPTSDKVESHSAAPLKDNTNQRVLISANEDLIAALGLNIQDMNDEQISEINDVVGEFTQIAVKGLMLILKSRSSLKSEFRMNVTTIQSAENNPLKFSPTLEDAMFNMFVRGGNAYKDPVTAVKEGIEGVADHQFSVFAGMRSAFNFLLERFNPQILEAKFDKQKSNSLLSSKKAKNWDLYSAFYQDIIKDRDDSFQYLFGDDFVQAYEQQMQQLKITRANSKEE
jgi:type VI secretion system FHA domain protein